MALYHSQTQGIMTNIINIIIIIIIISNLKPIFLYRGLALFDKSSSKASFPLRTVLRISRIHSKLLSVIRLHFIPGFHQNMITNMTINPFKHSILFMGHQKTVQNQIRCRGMRHLIRFCTVCFQNVHSKFE